MQFNRWLVQRYRKHWPSRALARRARRRRVPHHEGILMADLPPVSAIADVLALRGLGGWLTPPLRPIVAPSEPIAGRAVTVALQATPAGRGLGEVQELLSTSLDGAVLVMAGGRFGRRRGVGRDPQPGRRTLGCRRGARRRRGARPSGDGRRRRCRCSPPARRWSARRAACRCAPSTSTSTSAASACAPGDVIVVDAHGRRAHPGRSCRRHPRRCARVRRRRGARARRAGRRSAPRRCIRREAGRRRSVARRHDTARTEHRAGEGHAVPPARWPRGPRAHRRRRS